MKRLMLVVSVVFIFSGCSSPEPWVKPYERENLSDPVMNIARDPIAAGYHYHVFETRESARGAGAVTGGGCGCN
ncbi:MAG TPA: DUF4266 domain-containing protein [Gammaproteobacteria bacterium]|nr:DUF4266 domain-containing protein [Gammaproteobacteria bacterium]